MGSPATGAAARWLVFTDLDGTLLDARTYSAEPARGALAALAARGVPVVFCSSKTAAEQRPLRRALGVEAAPYIVENGAAVLVPEGAGLPVDAWPRPAGGAGERVRVLGRPAAEVRAGIDRAALATGRRFTGYQDLSVPEIARRTGLDEAAAARARQRDFSETLVDALTAADWAALQAALAAEGLRGQHGGRFHTVTGAKADKGSAARIVAELYGRAAGGPWSTVGLGDSANDRDLLAVVDRPYLIAREDGSWAEIGLPNLRRMRRPGPYGWSDAIADLLSDGDPA